MSKQTWRINFSIPNCNLNLADYDDLPSAFIRYVPKKYGRQIVAAAKIFANIERRYGFPCDIEWAVESGKFYITQSRPITTLTNQLNKFKGRLKTKK